MSENKNKRLVITGQIVEATKTLPQPQKEQVVALVHQLAELKESHGDAVNKTTPTKFTISVDMLPLEMKHTRVATLANFMSSLGMGTPREMLTVINKSEWDIVERDND